MYLVRIYTYFPGDDDDVDLSKHLDAMVEERGNSQAVYNLRMNLLEVHCKIRHRLKDMFVHVLAPLLDVLASTK